MGNSRKEKIKKKKKNMVRFVTSWTAVHSDILYMQ